MQRRDLLSLFPLGLLSQSSTFAAEVPSRTVTPTATLWLADAYRPGLLIKDYWVSEKYDGIRGHWDGYQLRTRAGNRLNPPEWFTHGWPTRAFEGELWIGRGRFEEVASVLQKKQASDDEWRSLRFMVFDMPQHPGLFTERWIEYQRLVELLAQPWVEAVNQMKVDAEPALVSLLSQMVASGAEGLMLHLGNASYKSGRSTDQLKVKPLNDAEAQVVGHEFGKGKNQARLGALWLETPQGLRFKLGTGFSNSTRESPPAIGEWVTYAYRGQTSKGTPRFASYIRTQPRIER